ncbi:hypothetical protein [Polaribacter sp. Z022]|uniref:hypothetical protein n=1 Tax=Polaribacter sp. Z022 TaxID=2927125 RepID=UPI002021BCBD|nr:hypothetical protein [Polaribacter sp. Z022]MCL7752148.1 hypothetical protein [Polaribacter sp. Z022]
MKTSLKWRTIIALILMYIALLLNWEWIWGFFLLIWVIPDLKSGTTFFIEPISKNKNPFVFWLIIISWGLMAIYSFYLLFLTISELFYF